MSKTYKGVDLKNALRHYGRPGMKKGRHLPGTTWWQTSIDGRNAAVSKASSQAAGSSSGSSFEGMGRQFVYELRKQRVKPVKGKIPNIRPQKRAMDAADEAKRRALEEEDIRRAAEIHGITPEEERQQRARGKFHQYVRDAQDRADEDRRKKLRMEAFGTDAANRQKRAMKETEDSIRAERGRELEKDEKKKKEQRDNKDAMRKEMKEAADNIRQRYAQEEYDDRYGYSEEERKRRRDAMEREIHEEEEKIREKHRKADEIKRHMRREKPKWFGGE